MTYRANNPFTPTFGHVPFALAGRSDHMDDVLAGLANRPGDPNRTTIFVGPRGSGKTVLLTAIAREAAEQGWVSTSASARKGMLEQLVWQARKNAGHLLDAQGSSSITQVQVGPVSLGREVQHASTSWWADLRQMVGELNARGVGLLITVDEVDPACEEFCDLVDAYQHLVRDDHDVALLLAGLPSRVSALLQDERISFIRRAFQRPLGPIPPLEVEEALLETIEAGGRRIDGRALALAAEAAQGFAFAVQLVGYYLWRVAEGELIGEADATEAVELARREMARSVFEPTLLELTPREEQYLRAMAVDDGPSATSEVARRMGISMTNASNLRRRLIEHGVISEVRMGQVTFEMPMLREYLR